MCSAERVLKLNEWLFTAASSLVKHVCRLWSSRNFLWVYDMIDVFGVWGSPSSNHLSTGPYIYIIYIWTYVIIYIYIMHPLTLKEGFFCFVDGFPEPTLTGCAESLALITVQGFVDGPLIFWASTNGILQKQML